MEMRVHGIVDRLIGEIDKAIKVLSVPTRARRSLPSAPEYHPLAEPARRTSARLMRVNHAGEVAAQALYRGQSLTTRGIEVKTALLQSAEEEMDHLGWCEQRLRELKTRPSVLNPLWYAGSFVLGAGAGALGDRLSLGFVAETEAQVESHLQGHLSRVGSEDTRTRAILESMQQDEVHHGEIAAALGGAALPRPVSLAMRIASKLMTQGSYWI